MIKINNRRHHKFRLKFVFSIFLILQFAWDFPKTNAKDNFIFDNIFGRSTTLFINDPETRFKPFSRTMKKIKNSDETIPIIARWMKKLKTIPYLSFFVWNSSIVIRWF